MSHYAYGGSEGGPCTTNRLTGDHEHHYPTPGVVGLEFARPRPVHALTPEALEAVESVRRLGRETRLGRVAARLVTDAGNVPPVAPYDGDVVTANARRLVADAEAAGFETKLIAYRDGCRVEGVHRARRCGFTATWTRGKADGADWREPWKYAIVNDPRPIGVAALTRTALKGKRGAGLDALHLAIVGSPRGVPISQAELKERIQS